MRTVRIFEGKDGRFLLRLVPRSSSLHQKRRWYLRMDTIRRSFDPLSRFCFSSRRQIRVSYSKSKVSVGSNMGHALKPWSSSAEVTPQGYPGIPVVSKHVPKALNPADKLALDALKRHSDRYPYYPLLSHVSTGDPCTWLVFSPLHEKKMRPASMKNYISSLFRILFWGERSSASAQSNTTGLEEGL